MTCSYRHKILMLPQIQSIKTIENYDNIMKNKHWGMS